MRPAPEVSRKRFSRRPSEIDTTQAGRLSAVCFFTSIEVRSSRTFFQDFSPKTYAIIVTAGRDLPEVSPISVLSTVVDAYATVFPHGPGLFCRNQRQNPFACHCAPFNPLSRRALSPVRRRASDTLQGGHVRQLGETSVKTESTSAPTLPVFSAAWLMQQTNIMPNDGTEPEEKDEFS